jgi:hypothetical protein
MQQQQITYAKHPTNTRIYVTHSLNAKWHIHKAGHGQRITHTKKLTACTTRFVATEQTTRPRVLAAPTLHELIAKLQLQQNMRADRDALGIY